MEKVPNKVVEYLKEVVSEGRLDAGKDIEEIVREYVDTEFATREGVSFLVEPLVEEGKFRINYDNYILALEEFCDVIFL